MFQPTFQKFFIHSGETQKGPVPEKYVDFQDTGPGKEYRYRKRSKEGSLSVHRNRRLLGSIPS